MTTINAATIATLELGQFLELPDFDKRYTYGIDIARLKKIGYTLELVYREGLVTLFSPDFFGFKVEGFILSAIKIDIRSMIMIRGAMLKTFMSYGSKNDLVLSKLNASYNLKKIDICDLRVEYKKSKPSDDYFNVGCRKYKSEVAIYKLFKDYSISQFLDNVTFTHPVDFGDFEKGDHVMKSLYSMLFTKIRRYYPLQDKCFIIGNKE